jgi:hypothetical protein
VWLEQWTAHAEIDLPVSHGLEIFVLQGSFQEGGETFQHYSWLRLPSRSRLVAQTGGQGCQVWLKQHQEAVVVPSS